jgi:deazaflavin-dependent oxidoreductase (nitroreductase family)
MLGRLLRSKLGQKLFKALCGEGGKTLDKFLFKLWNFSLIVHAAAAMNGMRPIPTLMIDTVGRPSGRMRSAVMPYIAINGRLYLIGFNGAKQKDPFWVENIRSNPNASIIINRKVRHVRGRVLQVDSSERAEVWNTEIALKAYHVFQRETARQIPIVASDHLEA